MDVYEESLQLHKKLEGKLKISSKEGIKSKKDLSLLYTPGVAQPCREIAEKPNKVFDYTGKGNLVAVISDGSAVLGLGNIGGSASLPVMEGKCAILSEFADIDAFPLVLNTQNPEEIISIVKAVAPSFGAINLEDIAAPKCFYIEEKLQEIGIPVFHDDQHGTAIVILAAFINALKVVGKEAGPLKIIVNGAGAAGQATAKLLLQYGKGQIRDLILLDSKGAIYRGRKGLDEYKKKIAVVTNKDCLSGSLTEVIGDADVFIGVSKPKVLTKNDIRLMNKKPIIFAMANPEPEIMPDEAKKAGAAVVATGRSDFTNQVNNALAFPGIFRGALDCRVERINDKMKIDAAFAIADLVQNPSVDNIIPSIFEKNLVKAVAQAVKKALN